MFSLIAASVWLSVQDPRLLVNGLPWLTENQHELIRLPRRLEASLHPAVWGFPRKELNLSGLWRVATPREWLCCRPLNNHCLKAMGLDCD